MGGGESAPRTLIVNNDDCDNAAVIQVSRDVAERIMNRSESNRESPSSRPEPKKAPPPSPPTSKEKAEAMEIQPNSPPTPTQQAFSAPSTRQPPPTGQQAPPPHQAQPTARQAPPASYQAAPAYRKYENAEETENFRSRENIYKEQIRSLEQQNAELMQSKLAQFSESIKRVEEKYLMETPVEVMGKLLLFTIIMCVVPIATYFGSKIYIFEELFLYPKAYSCVYAAIPAVIAVNLVIAAFVYVAWHSEPWPDEQQSQQQQQQHPPRQHETIRTDKRD